MLIVLHMCDDADAARSLELASDPLDVTDRLILVIRDDRLSS